MASDLDEGSGQARHVTERWAGQYSDDVTPSELGEHIGSPGPTENQRADTVQIRRELPPESWLSVLG